MTCLSLTWHVVTLLGENTHIFILKSLLLSILMTHLADPIKLTGSSQWSLWPIHSDFVVQWFLILPGPYSAEGQFGRQVCVPWR